MLKEWLSAMLKGNRPDDEAGRKLEPYLRDGEACVLLRLVLENPGIASDKLAQRSHMDKAVVEGYLNGMVQDGIVVVETEGAGAGYHIAGPAKAAVSEHLPLNYQCPGLQRE